MSKLLIKPNFNANRIHHVTPHSAGWDYVGFDLYKLAENEVIKDETQNREAILVWVEGRGNLKVDDNDFGELGDRMDVFEKKPPHAFYVPPRSAWQVVASTKCTLAVCYAPSTGNRKPQNIGGSANIETMKRGKGANTRYVNNIAMENQDYADSLLVTEVFTPQGNWSSYPSHRHDEDNFPDITYLEETYYHRLNPAQGFGFQRVYTEDGSLDESISFKNEDVVLVPKGHHPCGAPYGYDLYYLNVMAGPRRNWRFINDPDHDWIYQRDLNDK